MEGKDAAVLPIGKKALDYFTSHNVPVVNNSYPVAEAISVGDCFTIAKLLSKLYLAGQADEVILVYTDFHSVLSQTATTIQLLPLQAEPAEGQTVMEYEPDPETVLSAIIPEYLGGIFYGALCESRASEQAARRTAMDSATQNAEEMIESLSLQFNRARQAAITQEITEIVAGS
jgi:F-type H+-transporting ATPase subunit gamma